MAKRDRKPIRVWTDGCFDMVNFGYANVLKQIKSFGDVLVVGVYSDKETASHRGKLVFSEEERYKMVKSVKWVDEVVEDVPYVTRLDYLVKYNCDFCVHVSDFVLPVSDDGKDPYQEVSLLFYILTYYPLNTVHVYV